MAAVSVCLAPVPATMLFSVSHRMPPQITIPFR